ncbi:MAG: hypothetical protein HYZ75_10035 [Elusimicrobia bacterium]|nr:hypothetical protein [Elusimicrobiota bacterium]
MRRLGRPHALGGGTSSRYRSVGPIALAALAACATPQPVYQADDPLSGARPARLFYETGTSSGTAAFTAVLPLDYTPSDGILLAPVVAVLRRDTAFGEAAIVVERYGEQWGSALGREEFAAHLVEGRAPAPTQHQAGGRAVTAYHDLRFTLSERRIDADDPWAGVLGRRIEPPKLSPMEGRRFPVGGEAYRLHRCRRMGAWDVLADYRRAQAAGLLEAFRQTHPPEERRLVSTCFGSAVAHAVSEGRPVPPIPKPSSGRLRAMARQEWERGVVTRQERECVVLLDVPGGFWALRLRAPEAGFPAEHAGFLAFAAGFKPS